MSVCVTLVQFVHEFLQQPYSDLVCTVIIVTIFREVTFDFEINSDAVFDPNDTVED